MAGLVLDPSETAPTDTLPKSVSIDLPDGSVEINFESPDEPDEGDNRPAAFDENLALRLTEAELDEICSELLDGIEADINSRQDWIETRDEGEKLLGLAQDKPSEADGMKGMSSVYHPLLLEAVLRFQANARGELLPTDGPVKIRDDDVQPVPDEFAEAFERDFNHYLTVVATEFYPDTDKMLFSVGFGGTAFKKLYHDPIRRRPVSEMVDAKFLIVSNDTVDIQNASRITHEIRMRDTTMRRMQLVGAYRDIALAEPDLMPSRSTEGVAEQIDGRMGASVRTEDRERTVYECYCELDLPGYEHEDEEGALSGLPLPYKVSIDRSDRTILEIRRNWKEDDELQQRRQVFVPYTFVPGLGFYGIGLLHILGNATRAATAAWRILLDAGMRVNFPGGLVDKGATRQNKSDYRTGLGEFIAVDNPSNGPISNMFAPFPFKGPDPTMMALAQNVVETAQRVGGTAETNVGEGRADAPVGTTIALIEQATKILDAVHKRMHASQALEFQLFAELFREDPEAFWRSNRKPMLPWDEQILLYALNNCDLVPVADPNTSSHMQRMGKMQASLDLAFKLGPMAPMYFNIEELIKGSYEMMRIPNYQRFLNPNPPPVGSMPPQPGKGAGAAPPDPAHGQAAILGAQADQAQAQTGMFTAKNRAAVDQARLALEAQKADRAHQLAAAKLQLEAKKLAMDGQSDPNAGLAAHIDMLDAQTRRLDAQTRARGLDVKHADTVVAATQQAADRHSENSIASLKAETDMAIHTGEMTNEEANRIAQAEAAKVASHGVGTK